MASIFVSIANYRDAETVETVRALVTRASGLNLLNICILSQCDEDEHPDVSQWRNRPGVAIEAIRVDPPRAQGVGWARAEIQRRYAGEDFYLQLDSHVLLAQDWDAILLHDRSQIPSDAPAILTAYLPSYDFVDGERVIRYPRATEFRIAKKQDLPTATARLVEQTDKPSRAWFFSGHFAFADGSLVEDVPYDPEIFFLGEEISMAVRAYCNGYDLYTPSRFVGAHLYRRHGTNMRPRPLFWDGEDDSQRVVRWTERDLASKAKARAICRGEWRGLFGVRDLDRYHTFRHALRDHHGVDLADPTPLETLPQLPSAKTVSNISDVRSDPQAVATRGELAIVGVGICAIAQMTVEGIAAISAADIVFYNPTSPVLAAKLAELNPNCISLYRLYGEGKERRETYVQMAELMLREVRAGKRVAGVFHGHPGFFVSATRRAIRAAEQDGYPARMIPAVSSVDVLCADLGLDPGTVGLQVLKASTFLKGAPILATDSHVVFVQVGAVGDSTFSFTGFKKTRRPAFIQKLIGVYGRDQEAVYYRAAVLPGFRFETVCASLADFAGPLSETMAAGLLYLPPKGETLASMLDRQISKRRSDAATRSRLPKGALSVPADLRESVASPAMLKAFERIASDAYTLEQFRRNPKDFAAAADGLAPEEADALASLNVNRIRAVGRAGST